MSGCLIEIFKNDLTIDIKALGFLETLADTMGVNSINCHAYTGPGTRQLDAIDSGRIIHEYGEAQYSREPPNVPDVSMCTVDQLAVSNVQSFGAWISYGNDFFETKKL